MTGARVLLWGGGLVAGVRVGKATGVVYPPRAGVYVVFQSGGSRALGTQPPLAAYVVNYKETDT